MFCLSKPTSCTCTLTVGPILKWIVHFPNATLAGEITHIRGALNYNLSTQYPLEGYNYFTSFLVNETVGNMTANLMFTPNEDMIDFVIECRDNQSEISLKTVNLNGKKKFIIMKFIPISDIPTPPTNISSSNFTDTTFSLSWKPPLDDSCIEKYFINSSITEVSPVTTVVTNVTMTTKVNDAFTVRVACVDYSERKGNLSNGICIKLTGNKIIYPSISTNISLFFSTSCCK